MSTISFNNRAHNYREVAKIQTVSDVTIYYLAIFKSTCVPGTFRSWF
ncbi:unnamed protein product [Tenebrio molitor]|nr:unnamed protein product [Tenebrio molitor]